MRQAREWEFTSIMALAVLSLVFGIACGSDDSSNGTLAPTGGSDLPSGIAEQVSSMQTQAALLRSGREFKPALSLFQEILGLQEQYLLPNHEDIASTHDDLGLLRREMGNDSQALEHFQSSLKIREAINHPDIARSVTNLANLYYSIGDLDEALPLFERNLSILEATLPAFDPEIRESVDSLAEVLFSDRKYDDALKYFQRAVEFRERDPGPADLDTAEWRSNLAQLHEKLGNIIEAAKYYELAATSTELALDGKPVDIAARLNDLGELHVRQGDFDLAIPQFNRALEILAGDPGSEPLDTVDSLRGLGKSLSGQTEYELAFQYFDDALTIRKRDISPSHVDTATSMGELAELHRLKGEYRTSLSLSTDALAIWEAKDPSDPSIAGSLATALNNLGVLNLDMGEFGQAEQLLERAVDIRDDSAAFSDNPLPLAASLNNLAVLHRHTGDFARSLPLLERALEIIDSELSDHPNTAVSLNNLADFHFSINDFGRALPLYTRALHTMEEARGGTHPAIVPFLNNLADLNFEMNNLDEAESLFQRVADIQKDPDSPETATYLSNLAVLHRSKGDNEKALELYNDALEIRMNLLGPIHAATATSYNSIGALYSRMGERDKALTFLETALDIRRTVLGNGHPDTAVSLNNLAKWHEGERNYDRALEFYIEALSVEDSILNNVFSVASEEQKLAFTQANQATYHATLSLINRHFKKNPDAVRMGLDMVLVRKGIVLNSQSRAQSTIASNLQGANKESWQNLAALRGELSNLLISGPRKQDLADYEPRIAELNELIFREERFLAQNSSLMAQEFEQQQITSNTLAENLPDDVLLVEYVRIRDWSESTGDWTDDFRYLAFSLTSDNQVALIDLEDAAQIDAKIIDAIEIVGDPNYSSDLKTYARRSDSALSELYGLLLRPFEAGLNSRPRLIVSPDGEINKVPFVALRTSANAYLIETHTVSYVTSGRDLLRDSQESNSPTDLVLVADAAFDEQDVFGLTAGQERGLGGVEQIEGTIFGSGFPSLPGTAREADVIPPLVDGSEVILRGADATEEAVQAIKSPKVLHLATHGFFLQDSVLPLPNLVTASSLLGDGQERGVGGVENLRPLTTTNEPSGVVLNPMVRSGLAFAGANHAASVSSSGNDGILTALEVTGMDLRGTELVVLSACETAAGEASVGEGIFGLRRSFVLAGAENLVMSLWLVNDDLTVNQMERFYEGYGEGESIPESLRQAQLESINTLRGLTQEAQGESLAPVRLWAPFMVQQTGL